MKTIYFVRHGESEANAAGITAGSRIDAPLTAKGKQQAAEAGQKLHALSANLIVASPMQRARMTAQIIADTIKYNQQILTNELLTERDFGSLTGIRREGSLAEPNATGATGLETVADLFARMQRAYQWLRDLPGDHIVIAGHAGSGRMLCVVANGGAPEDFENYERLQNAHIYKFTVE
jgi:broad specificity phosphatase PhoE